MDIAQDQINALIDIFNREQRYCDERGNQKIDNPWEVAGVKEILTPVLDKLNIDTSKCFGDNFYKHNYEYLIHTDYREEDGPTRNVVVPLKMDPVDQFFIIFDQKWLRDGRTWARNSKKVYSPNIGLPGRPYDYKDEIIGLTDEDISDELFAYVDDIPHMPRDYFFGLTGYAVRWQPGSILQFHSQLLHCTGKMRTQSKLALLLRFRL